MKEIFDDFGIEKTFLIAGLVGALAGLSGKKSKLLAKLSSVIVGAGGAVYLTPLACEIADLTNEKSKLGVAVIIGYLGIQGVQNLIIKRLNDANIK